MSRRVGARFTIVTFLALVLTACAAGATGPSPTDPHSFDLTTTGTATTTTPGVEEALGSFRECLDAEGVQIPRVGLNGLGRPRMADALSGLDLSDRQVLDALESCGHHLSSGSLDLRVDPELARLVRETLREFAECVRLEGVADYPDPIPGFDGVGSPFPVEDIPWSEPDLTAAVENCRDVMGPAGS